jgi:hypothetical protein
MLQKEEICAVEDFDWRMEGRFGEWKPVEIVL